MSDNTIWTGLSFNPGRTTLPADFLENFLKGYSEENNLKEQIIDQIPMFLKLREIFLYWLFHQRWDLSNLEDWQEYTLVQLRKNIENDIIPYMPFPLRSF